jgi:transcriptional regulator with PAS, ATPase and Fis domain
MDRQVTVLSRHGIRNTLSININLLKNNNGDITGALETFHLAEEMNPNLFNEPGKLLGLVGNSPAMRKLFATLSDLAASRANVLICGESGTGKELVAKAIHTCSDRKEADLIYVNCSAIPENLIESEFFGYKQGAFTGAVKDKPGFLDMADQGTLFLDEVGELPPSLQVKLLRVMEGYGYTPVGATKVKKPNFRIIAATHRDLKALTEQGLMRHDFLYRIHVIPVHLPPLRERKEDISLLVDHFLEQYAPEKLPPITPGIIKALQSYEWPGNVRELQNTIHRFVSLKKLDFLNVDCAYPLEQKAIYESHSQKETALTEIMERYEREILEAKLAQFKWHKSKAAEALKIDRKTLFNKMKKYDLAP